MLGAILYAIAPLHMIYVKSPGLPRRRRAAAAAPRAGVMALRAALPIALAGALAAALPAPAAAQDKAQPRLPTITLTAGMHRITAEVAATPHEQSMGLMFRREMDANDGMLFVYETPQRMCFWMRNTVLPLSIAFIADDGRIVNIRDMQPLTENSHCSDAPVRYALEMHQGWFAKRGIGPGFRLRGEPFRP